jgi:hypothetical protein
VAQNKLGAEGAALLSPLRLCGIVPGLRELDASACHLGTQGVREIVRDAESAQVSRGGGRRGERRGRMHALT